MKMLHETATLIVACETYVVCGDKVLMHKRPKDKQLFPGYWIGPGGHIEWGETPESAAIREIAEETGVKIQKSKLILKVIAFHHHLDRNEIWVEYIFRADLPSLAKTRNISDGKSRWLDIKTINNLKKVFPPSKHYFHHIFNKQNRILYGFSTWRNSQLVKEYF